MSVLAGPADWWTDRIDAGRIHMATKGVIQNGIVFNVDAGVSSSYPGSGTILYDIKNSLNLTLSGGITYSSSDFYGALVFNGGAQSATLASVAVDSPISVSNNFTIEQIYKPTSYQTSNYFGLTNMLLHKGSATTFNFATQVTSDTSVSFIKRTSPESLQYHAFTVPSMQGKVCFLTFVVENGFDISIDTVTCYMNGTLIGSLAITGAAITPVANDPVYLGSLGGTTYTTLIGSYYSGRVYNRALTVTEIKQNFNALRGRFGV
jgi:hypothetical protein